MKHLAALVLLTSGPVFAAADVCEAPRLRDTSALAAAAAQDKVLATAFQKAASVCSERGDACDQARVECGGLLTSILQRQRGFDEGMWLRDLLLPHFGQQYSPTRAFGTYTLAPDASCNVDVPTLIAASQRRRDQAARREGLFQEYGLFSKWTDTAVQRCRDRQAQEQQKSATVKAESEQLSAAALAANAAELARKQAETDARLKADEDARRIRAAQDAAAAMAIEQTRQRELAEQRARQERLDFEQRARQAELQNQERTRQQQLEDQQRNKLDRDQERQAAMERSRIEQDQRFVSERDQKTSQLKAQKRLLVEEAEASYKLALAEESTRRQAAMDAVRESPAISQAAVEQAAQAEQNRIVAEHTLAEARLKAERIEIDESYERSRGHLGVLGGGGALGYSNDSGGQTGGGLGAMITAHLGFWGQAPAAGLENGLEVALAARFFQTLGGSPQPREFEGHATVRYFFGPLGLGVGGEGRSFDSSYGIRGFGLGPSLAIAAADTRSTRVIISANWLPVGTAIDLTRITGEFEIAYEWFTMRILGGSFNQSLASGAKVGWQVGGFAGVRFTW